MRKVLSTKKSIVVWGAILLVAVSGYLYFFSTLKNSAANVSDLATELSYQTDRATRLNSVETIVRDTEEERAQLKTFFLSEDDIVDFITEVESLGNSLGVPIDVLSVSSETPEVVGTGGVLELRVTFDGPWNSVVSMLALLETQEIATTLNKVSLSYKGHEDSEWSVTATLQAQMFKYEE